MARYSLQSRDRIFVKDYVFWSFAKNIFKNMSKILSGKHSQKSIDHAKRSATDAFRYVQKKSNSKNSGSSW